MAVTNALLLIDVEDGWQQRIVLTQNQGVVEVLQHIPCYLLNLVAGINHVHTLVD